MCGPRGGNTPRSRWAIVSVAYGGKRGNASPPFSNGGHNRDRRGRSTSNRPNSKLHSFGLLKKHGCRFYICSLFSTSVLDVSTAQRKPPCSCALRQYLRSSHPADLQQARYTRKSLILLRIWSHLPLSLSHLPRRGGGGGGPGPG